MNSLEVRAMCAPLKWAKRKTAFNGKIKNTVLSLCYIPVSAERGRIETLQDKGKLYSCNPLNRFFPSSSSPSPMCCVKGLRDKFVIQVKHSEKLTTEGCIFVRGSLNQKQSEENQEKV